jgi:hypothetical protein
MRRPSAKMRGIRKDQECVYALGNGRESVGQEFVHGRLRVKGVVSGLDVTKIHAAIEERVGRGPSHDLLPLFSYFQ